MQNSQLPCLDEHATTIAADVHDVWPVLAEAVNRAFSGAGRPTRLRPCRGWTGGLYRLLVIGTRGHVVLLRRLLTGIRRRSEPS
ncbi:hypothetical protein ABGB18_20195 [Nonomuraea sp. B12E4]|uniref:hypothetical protein n=1 Tax=Nonomuraea sp. B12E4 TaxID=3153564 RepID=UPI00325D4F6B